MVLKTSKVGDEFFLPLNIRFSHRWRDVGIYFCFFGKYLRLVCWWSMYLIVPTLVFNFIATISKFNYFWAHYNVDRVFQLPHAIFALPGGR